jgi:PIN domain nuclease of toxin-antitoxin system
MSFLLDASALLAALFDEPGGDYVFDIISDAHISVVNLSEVYATLLDGGTTFEEAQGIVTPLPLCILSFESDHAIQAAKLRPLTKSFGLSLGDRACIAHAIINDLPVLTSDRRMAEAKKTVGIDIQMIR